MIYIAKFIDGPIDGGFADVSNTGVRNPTDIGSVLHIPIELSNGSRTTVEYTCNDGDVTTSKGSLCPLPIQEVTKAHSILCLRGGKTQLLTGDKVMLIPYMYVGKSSSDWKERAIEINRRIQDSPDPRCN